ncbi:MAG: hypothetical protein IJN09_04840 [Oscillospiraceae bacterium]|nr:hypothetical protein [Oscillospiraceae bacterium]
MDGFFEKFGLYDFFSMFVSGIISESIAVVVAAMCFGTNIEWTYKATWLYLIIGYFIGLILHEIAGRAEKRLKKFFSRNVLSKKKYFFDNDYDEEMLEQVKIHILGGKEKYTEKDEEYITSVCVNELQTKNAIASSDRLKTQSEMALSICIATAVIGTVTLIFSFVGKINIALTIATVIALLIASMIFFARSRRMHRYYIRCLIRTYAVLNNLERNEKGE